MNIPIYRAKKIDSDVYVEGTIFIKRQQKIMKMMNQRKEKK